jgi:hypothetical protein
MRPGDNLPSPQEFARALGGYVSASGVVRAPGPGRDPKDRSLTVTFDPAGPDGFIVADGRGKIDGLAAKDYVREKVGLPPFSRARQGRSNGAANGHRPAGGSIAHDHQPTERPTSITPSPPRIYLIPFGQIRLNTDCRDVVHGLIPHDGITIVYGAPKCGKSFWMLDLGMHVALGREYRGRKVSQGPTVLCAFEGQKNTGKRVEAWRQQFLAEDHAPDEVEFYLMPVTISLVHEHAELIAAITETSPKPPTLIILDTLNRSFVGSESNDADMTAYIRAADTLRETFGSAVVIVHHCGHDTNRPRGHTSLIGAADAVIAVKKQQDTSIFFVTVEMMKDGETGAVLASQIENVEVGYNGEGLLITSCVVRPIESVTPINKPRFSGATAHALRVLENAIIEYGEIVPATGNIPPNTRTISLIRWRQDFVAQSITDSDKPDTQSKAFRRCAEKLKSLNEIGVWNERVWLIGQKRTSWTGHQMSEPTQPGQDRTPPLIGVSMSGKANGA